MPSFVKLSVPATARCLGEAPEVLDRGRQQELIVRAGEPAEAQAGQAEIALHVGEAGLDYLPLAGGDAVVLGLHEAPGKVARGFVHIARDLARGLLRATSEL